MEYGTSNLKFCFLLFVDLIICFTADIAMGMAVPVPEVSQSSELNGEHTTDIKQALRHHRWPYGNMSKK